MIERMAKLWALTALLLFVGCELSPARTCQADDDCEPGGHCDLEQSVCFGSQVDAGGVCEPSCAQSEQCVERTCAARYSALTLESPVPAVLRPATAFTARAKLSLAPGREDNPPSNVSLVLRAVDGGESLLDLPRVGDGYEVSAAAPTAEGLYRVSARYEEAGLRSAEVELWVDATPPLLEVTLSPPPARPAASGGTSYVDPAITDGGVHRRDEQVTVTVTASEALSASSVNVQASIGTGAVVTVPVQSQPPSACGRDGGYCGTAPLNLWLPPMNAFRERLSVTVNAEDLAGNAGPPTTVGAHVTRFKWRYEAGTTVSTPALDTLGNVYLVIGNAPVVGTLRSLDSSGRQRFIIDAGVPGTSPAVGREDGGGALVYWGSGGTSAGLFAVRTQDAGFAGSCGPYSGPFEGGLGLMTTDVQGEVAETAVGVAAVGGGTLVAQRPGASFAACLSRMAVGTMPTDPSSIVSHQNSVFFGNETGQVASYSFNGSAASWDPRSGWPAGANLFTRALAVVGTEIVGGGGAGLPSRGGVFTLPANTGLAPSWEYRTATPAWSPAVGAGGGVVVGVDGPTVLAVVLGADAGVSATTAGVVRGTPVLGEGGWVYLVSVDGTLSVRRATPGAAAAWEHAGLGQVRASASLDCARDSSGTVMAGRPGTLYVPDFAGTLHAIIVDSRGLDATAPWPKYQRDVHNSGNPERPIVPCP